MLSCLYMLRCQTDCGCLMEMTAKPIMFIYPNGSQNQKTTKKEKNTNVAMLVQTHVLRIQGGTHRATMRLADSCCFHDDWFPSHVRGGVREWVSAIDSGLPFPATRLSFHFSISFSSAAAGCIFFSSSIFLFPADDRERVKCEIRKSVCK